MNFKVIFLCFVESFFGHLGLQQLNIIVVHIQKELLGSSETSLNWRSSSLQKLHHFANSNEKSTSFFSGNLSTPKSAVYTVSRDLPSMKNTPPSFRRNFQLKNLTSTQIPELYLQYPVEADQMLDSRRWFLSVFQVGWFRKTRILI
jgi:hypothetical protein